MAEKEYIQDDFTCYLGKKDRISSSDIKNFLKSPKYYFFKKYEEIKDDSDKEKRHLLIGSALHELILEPHKFDSHYCVAVKFDMRTTVGKQNHAEQLQKSIGKKLIFEEEMDVIKCIADSTSKNKTFSELIKNSYKELSIYTTDEITGLKIKLRPDVFPRNKSVIIDLKSCLDSSPKGFTRDVYNYHYSISAAFYSDFSDRDAYVFFAMEKENPYQTSLYILSDDKVQYGRDQYRMALDLIAWSYKNNFWCDYNEMALLKDCYKLGELDFFFEKKEIAINLITRI